MFAEQESLQSFCERFNSIMISSRQMASCSTLEQLQYEKHVLYVVQCLAGSVSDTFVYRVETGEDNHSCYEM